MQATNNYVTGIIIEYDGGLYSSSAIDAVQENLAPFGRSKAYRFEGPASGPGFSIQVIVEFFGISIASGLIGHIATKYYEQIIEVIRTTLQRDIKLQTPLIDTLQLKYDDINLHLRFTEAEILEKLPALLNEISKHINSEPLSECLVSNVYIPAYFAEARWEIYTINTPKHITEHIYRYWKVQSRSISGCSGIYDTKTRKIIEEGEAINIT